ncbi:hypothetical protein NDU88_002505 [Pleurodeles waltl]|uniref:Uncharacterized protein n=1 Tax=Pleurodeles waltl TaxID=8319 RepID=A0AAV7TKW9_PLEWA|nr:hypothetical protein NDU88_002505 [Pleurodeles waltl]
MNQNGGAGHSSARVYDILMDPVSVLVALLSGTGVWLGWAVTQVEVVGGQQGKARPLRAGHRCEQGSLAKSTRVEIEEDSQRKARPLRADHRCMRCSLGKAGPLLAGHRYE